jgi:hypothetical protein
MMRFAAAAVALHGLLLLLAEAIRNVLPQLPDVFGEVLLWALAVPALLLTSPFTSLLWKFGLMNAPGWFAWPKPLGIALAYAIWIAAFLLLAMAIQRMSRKN